MFEGVMSAIACRSAVTVIVAIRKFRRVRAPQGHKRIPVCGQHIPTTTKREQREWDSTEECKKRERAAPYAVRGGSAFVSRLFGHCHRSLHLRQRHDDSD